MEYGLVSAQGRRTSNQNYAARQPVRLVLPIVALVRR
jgi:hypothetical protein